MKGGRITIRMQRGETRTLYRIKGYKIVEKESWQVEPDSLLCEKQTTVRLRLARIIYKLPRLNYYQIMLLLIPKN